MIEALSITNALLKTRRISLQTIQPSNPNNKQLLISYEEDSGEYFESSSRENSAARPQKEALNDPDAHEERFSLVLLGGKKNGRQKGLHEDDVADLLIEVDLGCNALDDSGADNKNQIPGGISPMLPNNSGTDSRPSLEPTSGQTSGLLSSTQ